MTAPPAPPHRIEGLLAIMARLRDPDGGCPWDREQTFASIAPHTIEEAYEVAEAIESGNRAHLKDELGDLLFQVVYHARLAEEEGAFAFPDVVAAIADKLVRRHPHVFGGGETIADATAQTAAWEAHKAAERAAKAAAAGQATASALDGVSTALPAITRALKLQNRAARIGFDWERAEDVVAKIEEELAEVRAEFIPGPDGTRFDPDRLRDEIGDLLFTVVNLARKAGIDPEGALRHTNQKFERRFRRVEDLVHADDGAMAATPLDILEALWVRAKQEQRT